MAEENVESFDVVVVGGGLAGHCAALGALEIGAKTLLLEKQADYGGSSILSGGSMSFAGTEAQSLQQISDSPDRLKQDLFDVGGHRNDPALVELFVDRQLETYEWLKSLGIVFHRVQLSSNMSVPRSHPVRPKELLETLHGRALDAGVHYRSNAAVKRLIQKPGEAIVTGVTAEIDGKSAQIVARGGVVLATGGFARDKALVEKFVPDQANALRLGGEGNTGDGLVMAWSLGADIADIPYVMATFGVAMPDYPGSSETLSGPRSLVHAMYRGAVIVNRDAKRFADESKSYKTLGDLCLRQPDALGFQIFDQKVMDQSVEMPITHNYREALDRGLLKTASTIGDLAKTVGLDSAALQATVDRYNKDVAAGEDTVLGRRTLGRGYGALTPIDTAPFYIFPCTSALFSTYGGVKVNNNLEVVRIDGQAISGLYAVGEIMGGLHGEAYMSGSSLSKSAIFGRLAGRHAANGANTSGKQVAA
jgi:fumarate reductase flavoprotein subunit